MAGDLARRPDRRGPDAAALGEGASDAGGNPPAQRRGVRLQQTLQRAFEDDGTAPAAVLLPRRVVRHAFDPHVRQAQLLHVALRAPLPVVLRRGGRALLRGARHGVAHGAHRAEFHERTDVRLHAAAQMLVRCGGVDALRAHLRADLAASGRRRRERAAQERKPHHTLQHARRADQPPFLLQLAQLAGDARAREARPEGPDLHRPAFVHVPLHHPERPEHADDARRGAEIPGGLQLPFQDTLRRQTLFRHRRRREIPRVETPGLLAATAHRQRRQAQFDHPHQAVPHLGPHRRGPARGVEPQGPQA